MFSFHFLAPFQYIALKLILVKSDIFLQENFLRNVFNRNGQNTFRSKKYVLDSLETLFFAKLFAKFYFQVSAKTRCRPFRPYVLMNVCQFRSFFHTESIFSLFLVVIYGTSTKIYSKVRPTFILLNPQLKVRVDCHRKQDKVWALRSNPWLYSRPSSWENLPTFYLVICLK